MDSSAGEITADHARSTVLKLKDRFIQQRPVSDSVARLSDRDHIVQRPLQADSEARPGFILACCEELRSLSRIAITIAPHAPTALIDASIARAFRTTVARKISHAAELNHSPSALRSTLIRTPTDGSTSPRRGAFPILRNAQLGKALVQIAGSIEMLLINMDTLSITNDSVADGRRSGVPQPESGKAELALANSMHQLNA